MYTNERSPSKQQNVFPHIPLSCNLSSDSSSYQWKINIGMADKLEEVYCSDYLKF